MPDCNARANLFFILIIAVATVFAVSTVTVAASSGTSGNSTAMTQTDSLVPVLDELVTASDRESYARTHNLEFNDDHVVVVIELEAGSDPPDGYDVAVEHTYSGAGQNLVQASVSVDQLRNLAAEDTVDYVRLPQEATPMEGGNEKSALVTDDLHDGDNSTNDTDNADDFDTDDSGKTDTDLANDTDDALGTWLPAVAAVAVLLAWAGLKTTRGGARGR